MKSRIINGLIALFLKISNPDLELRLSMSILSRRAKYLSPDEGMKHILEADNRLYVITQQVASYYGDGISPKHRLLGYHQFFYSRISQDDVVLDIGSHEGHLTFAVATNTGAKVDGVEIVPERLQVAKEKYNHPNIQFILADITKHPLDKKYDVIVMSNVLEHLPQRVEFLKKAKSNTSAKRFLIRVPRFDRDWRIPLKKEVGVDWRLDDEHTIEYTPETFQEEMREAGLEIQHLESRWGEFWAELTVNQ